MSEPFPLEPDALLARNPQVLASDMDGEVVLLALDSGAYYTLTGAGSALWKALEEPRRVGDLLASLVRNFEVSEEQCRAETGEFLLHMVREGILEIQGGAPRT